MMIRALTGIALACALSASAFAQNANTNTQPASRTRTTAPTNANTAPPSAAPEETTPATGRTRAQTARRQTASDAPEAATRDVLAAFNTLLDGIRRADVDTVMSVYWNSPQLIIFNFNGTTTRTWEQVRANRSSSYPHLTDVRLDVRDVRTRMLGANAALVTCLWTQAQTARGTPETSTGRLTLVFQRIGGQWKVIHTHTSPDAPDPSRIPPSERATPTPPPPPRP